MHYRRLAVALLVACVACGWVWSQDAPKPGAKPTAAQESPEKLTGRLPNYYGQVGLSEVQRQKIYALQAQYGDQIDALIRQVEELRQKRDKEVEDVLTAEQKTKLKALTDAAAAKKKTSKTKAAPE
jgi:Spy/CpxP family protein refolding chaperone